VDNTLATSEVIAGIKTTAPIRRQDQRRSKPATPRYLGRRVNPGPSIASASLRLKLQTSLNSRVQADRDHHDQHPSATRVDLHRMERIGGDSICRSRLDSASSMIEIPLRKSPPRECSPAHWVFAGRVECVPGGLDGVNGIGHFGHLTRRKTAMLKQPLCKSRKTGARSSECGDRKRSRRSIAVVIRSEHAAGRAFRAAHGDDEGPGERRD